MCLREVNHHRKWLRKEKTPGNFWNRYLVLAHPWPSAKRLTLTSGADKLGPAFDEM